MTSAQAATSSHGSACGTTNCMHDQQLWLLFAQSIILLLRTESRDVLLCRSTLCQCVNNACLHGDLICCTAACYRVSHAEDALNMTFTWSSWDVMYSILTCKLLTQRCPAGCMRSCPICTAALYPELPCMRSCPVPTCALPLLLLQHLHST